MENLVLTFTVVMLALMVLGLLSGSQNASTPAVLALLGFAGFNAFGFAVSLQLPEFLDSLPWQLSFAAAGATSLLAAFAVHLGHTRNLPG